MQQIQSKGQNMTNIAYSQCPVCKGTGREIVKKSCPEIYGDNTLLEYAVPCTRCNGAIAQRAEVVRQRANIPSSFYDKYIGDFDRNIYMQPDGKTTDISKVMQAVDSFIDDFSKWDAEGLGLYICSGMKGSGKTFLASCICNSLIKKYPINTKFVSASNLLNLSKQSDGSGHYDTDTIALLCNCKLLVIDDLGQKNGGSDWMNDVLFQITNARYQQKLVTIYTSNVKISNLELDDRIVDRINRTTFQLSLPEYCVRAREANEKKKRFLTEIGIL